MDKLDFKLLMTQEEFTKFKDLTREEVVLKLKELREQGHFYYNPNQRFHFQSLKKTSIFNLKFNSVYLLLTEKQTKQTLTFYRFCVDYQSFFQIQL